MCGIAGFCGFEDTSIGHARLERMRRSLAHRGPDASGLFLDEAAGAGLAHTRLSILDPTARADQPFHHTQRWTLAFNGEIYNFRALRTELESKGESFHTQSDTEVVAVLLARGGENALQRLEGMYALAFWDAQERTLLLARDNFGIKPLYLTTKAGPLAFASEVRTLIHGGWVDPTLSPEGVASYFQRGSSDPENPLIHGLRSLAPGSWLVWKDGATRAGTLPPIPLDSLHPQGDARAFRRTFLDSVQRHLTSDVPVALFLSGGIDSSAILAAIHASGHTPPTSLTLSFPGTPWDEAGEAAAVASRFDSPHRIRTLDPDREIIPWFRDHLVQQDLPSIDGFNVFCISRVAREQQFKVVLSGLGGDELLGGYPSFRNIPRMIRTSHLLRTIPGASGIAKKLLNIQGGRGRRLARFLEGPPTTDRAFAIYREIFPPSSIRHFGKILGLNLDSNCDAVPDHSSLFTRWGDDLRGAVSAIESTHYMGRQLLRDADACSMAHGVELRVPYLDVPLWKTTAQLPLDQRFESGKRLLSHALPELPDALFTRPKRGFTLPWNDWLDGPLQTEWEAVPREARSRCTTWYQRLAWISLIAWKHHLTLNSSSHP
jgi:asparagine synthase (glutamine-hydrolysing)